MKRSEVTFGLLRIPLDLLGIFAALLLAYRLREWNMDFLPGTQVLEPARLPEFGWYVYDFVLPSSAVIVFFAACLKLYSLKSTLSAWSEMGRLLATVCLWLVTVIAWYFLVQKQLFFSRLLLIHATVMLGVFLASTRAAVTLLQRAMARMGIGTTLVISVGSEPVARAARDTLKEDRRYDYLGHVPNLSALKGMAAKCAIDLVLQTDPSPAGKETIELIEYCRSRQIGYGYLPPVLADVPHLLNVERLGLLPVIRLQPTPLDGWGRVWKRLFDLAFSSAALLLLAPLLLLLAAVMWATNGLPILYFSKRVGQNGSKVIPVWKFRSMVRNADDIKPQLMEHNERRDGPLFKLSHDPRITGVGRFLRRFDLDELPQLVNVLLGHMSLVGPRPHLPEEVARYQAHDRRVFAVKPGITGLAQVSGRSSLTFKEEVHLDIQYIEEWSLFLDLWILWRTVFVVLQGKSRG